MATLTGATIASTYPLLLKIKSTGIDGTMRFIQDGDGTDSAFKISTAGATVLGTLTVGVDNTGADVTFFGATTGHYLLWDESGDDLILAGTGSTLSIDSTVASTSTTTGSFHTDGGVGIALDLFVGDDLSLLSDSAVFNMGAGNDFTITHDGTTGATLAGTPISINSTGDLTLDSSTDIVLDAAGGNFEFKDAGTAQLTIDVDSTAGDINIDLEVNGDDLVFRQYDATEVMRITDDATVGIGEPAPDAFLSINQGTDDSSILTFKSSDVAHGMTDIVETDSYGRFRKVVAAYGGLKIDGFNETGEFSSMIIEGNGVDDDATRTTSARGNIELRNYKKSSAGHTGMNANQNMVVISNAVSAKFIFDSDGDAHADGSAGFTVYSDLRLKTDIETIPYGLAEVLQLQPKKFKKASGSFDEDGNVVLEDNARVSIGFIAQELKLIIPEMIKEIDETSSFYGLNVGQVTPVLVKAIQELSASNDALKARIEVLEG